MDFRKLAERDYLYMKIVYTHLKPRTNINSIPNFNTMRVSDYLEMFTMISASLSLLP